ncbi:hypothetical protein ACFOSV_12620 [Algoriphagus namhaensis]|uniref:Uncharacterized protein n=1 Tax=Algoriphagus namhaensis TaxID=915353 RepID=A0ABV8ATQ9_9BACT
MKFKLIAFSALLALLSISSCRDEDIGPLLICGVYDPVLELTWLAQKTAQINQAGNGSDIYLSAGVYQGQSVIIEKNCCISCGSVFVVYACDGQVLGFLGTGGIDPASIEDETIIWRGANFTCGV